MSVIFSRAPLRISLGGGGTDLPSYYGEHGGFLVSGAIDKYIYMLTHTVFQQRYRMKYSEIEEVDTPREIKHPILRETLLRHWQRRPAGDRLGRRRPRRAPAWAPPARSPSACSRRWRWPSAARSPPGDLAEAACEIEIDVLKEPVGKQDQYVSAHGGICAYTFNADGTVDVEPLDLDRDDAAQAAQQPAALLHRRGARRRSTILADQVKRTERERRRDGRQPPPHQGDGAARAARCSSPATSSGYAELMHEHWENKRDALAGHDRRAHRQRSTRSRAAPAPSAASWSARAAAASCSSTPRSPRTPARRWPPRARPSCPSTSSSRARSGPSTRDGGCGSASSAAA